MEAERVREILCAPNIPAMIRTLLTENGLEWWVFNYEFEQVDYDGAADMHGLVGARQLMR